MSRFLDALHSGRVLLMDGAMGTELQRAGIGKHECYELWNLTHPERVGAVHEAYVSAGAECLVTNTFQANPVALRRHGLENRLEEINAAGVALARAAGKERCFVLGSIGPIDGDNEVTIGRVVRSLQDADGILLETQSSMRILLAAKHLRTAPCNPRRLPILVSFAFQLPADRGKSASPSPIVSGAQLRRIWVGKRNIAALGVNCGRDMGPFEIAEVLGSYQSPADRYHGGRSRRPMFARPNAGTPTRIGDSWHYPLTPEALARAVPELLGAGATMIGGCCGTTPAHIAALRQALDNL